MTEYDEPNWEGLPDTSEHRTVGSHRAWCFSDGEWCYPDDLCWCCDQTQVPDQWRGEHVGTVLRELGKQVQALRHDGLSAKNSRVVLKREVLALLGSDPDQDG